jgi:hypothetical protein
MTWMIPFHSSSAKECLLPSYYRLIQLWDPICSACFVGLLMNFIKIAPLNQIFKESLSIIWDEMLRSTGREIWEILSRE